jgi:hypothetical protein
MEETECEYSDLEVNKVGYFLPSSDHNMDYAQDAGYSLSTR